MLKKWMIASFLSLAMLAVAGCGSIPIGDGGSISFKKDGFTLNSDDDQNGSIDISVNDNGEMTLSGSDESGQTFEQKVSKEQKLPDAFPQDIPLPADAELTVIESEINGKMQYIVTYRTEGKVIDVYNQYRQYVDQAEYSNIIDASEGNAKADTALKNMLAKSDESTLSISIMKSGTGKYDDGTIAVNMMYSTDIEQRGMDHVEFPIS